MNFVIILIATGFFCLGVSFAELILKRKLLKDNYMILSNGKKIKYIRDEECSECEVGAEECFISHIKKCNKEDKMFLKKDDILNLVKKVSDFLFILFLLSMLFIWVGGLILFLKDDISIAVLLIIWIIVSTLFYKITTRVDYKKYNK